MAKNIIILNGSPRPKGNTSSLTEAFRRGAEEADIVVLASPLYYWFISGFLKNAFDRLFAVAEEDKSYRNPVKESVLIMAAEGAGFEESEHWYDHLERHIGWRSLGKILCGYVTQPGDINGRKELHQAYELGKSVR